MPSHRVCANAIRALAMDAVQQANSGHPGMPMGMADIAEVLWRDYLRHNPANPNWVNRDRFIVSNGHGAMLLYSLLYLTGYDMNIQDLQQFRQWESRTPGHPEFGHAPGVETTTGPLGQGLGNAVGMALAEKILAAHFNTHDFQIVDHYTYVFVGDGCLMEGLSHEVCSLAGTLGLGKLIVFYDDNGISIDGDVRGWFTDDTAKRFEAYHWHVIPTVDGHDHEAIRHAIDAARRDTRPTLIQCKTQIGFGAPNKANTAAAHGAPLGADEIALARKALEWEHPPFVIPADILADWNALEAGKKYEAVWQEDFKWYRKDYPLLADELSRRLEGRLPPNFAGYVMQHVRETQAAHPSEATRQSSQTVLESLYTILPELLGGSADLTGSNNTNWSGSKAITREDAKGNYLYYGVREFGMSAIMNGLARHGGFIPYGGTFLVFSDYARNAIRLSALMKQKVIYVLTHDSIGLGEDGPTHQPIEHIASLRMIPDLRVWRPCDRVETWVAWEQAIQHQGPSCLLLSRQKLPFQLRAEAELITINRGGYIVYDDGHPSQGVIIATGSEVGLAVEAAKALQQEQYHIRVVSMPCCEVFREQDEEYQNHVLPQAVKARLAVEAGVTNYWYSWIGSEGGVIGIDTFGASAPGEVVLKQWGFTVDNVTEAMRNLL
ncbi:MAG TPA: transketolase [Coxiellaceae bacterium]|nr:transketolase [Coxiellaceae bacterium]